jgi:hypothetical protein
VRDGEGAAAATSECLEVLHATESANHLRDLVRVQQEANRALSASARSSEQIAGALGDLTGRCR